jgi:hypothetical protein
MNSHVAKSAGLLAAPAAAGRDGALHDVRLRGTNSFSKQGLFLFHALIGAAALAVPSK